MHLQTYSKSKINFKRAFQNQSFKLFLARIKKAFSYFPPIPPPFFPYFIYSVFLLSCFVFFSFLMSSFVMKFSHFPPIFPLLSLLHLFSISAFLIRIFLIPYVLLRYEVFSLPSHFPPSFLTSFIQYFCFPVSYSPHSLCPASLHIIAFIWRPKAIGFI